MDCEVVSIDLLKNDTETLKAELRIYEEDPHNRDNVLLEISFKTKIISKSAEDFFSALQEIRKELEKEKILLLCNGSAENVYPSPMQRNGSKAYILESGCPAKLSNVVDIFDRLDSLIPVSVEAQENFYAKWLKSL